MRCLASFRCRQLRMVVPVAVLTLSLAVSVATRFVHYYRPLETGTKATEFSAKSKRQDLEKDALQWAAPILVATLLLPPRPERLEFRPIRLPRPPLIDYSRYNRPPPAC